MHIYSTTQPSPQPPNISFTILNNDTTTSPVTRIEGHSSTSSIITGALISGVLLLLLAVGGVLFLVCVLRAKASRREGTDQSEEIHQEKKKNEAYICAGKEGQIVRPKQVHSAWGLILPYFLDQTPPSNSRRPRIVVVPSGVVVPSRSSSPLLPDLECYSRRPRIVAALQLEHTDHTHYC